MELIPGNLYKVIGHCFLYPLDYSTENNIIFTTKKNGTIIIYLSEFNWKNLGIFSKVLCDGSVWFISLTEENCEAC